MSRIAHAAQIVNVTQDHNYVLDERKLQQILLKDEIKDLPVVLVSVAGTYRGGKSFLLNFFLRYFTSSKDAQENGSWLGDDSDPLTGFSWRGGSKKDTSGILMWSEPFIVTIPSGMKVAVFVMDTQGNFDSTSTIRDCSTIFALSTLLSSVQIYNVSQNIQEDHLQYLQLFTEYGRLVQSHEKGKPFQILKFLVRDWPYPWEYAFGAEGGNQLLKERLRENPDSHDELRDLRKHLHSCFEEITGFLMPHPGFSVLRPDFKGNICEISAEFRKHLADLVLSLFKPEKLQPKLVNGKPVKVDQLHKYFKTYMNLFNSDQLPTPMSIMKATAEIALQGTLRDGLVQYMTKMESECGENAPCVPAVDIRELHDQQKKLVLSTFDTKKMMGSKEEIARYYETLSKDIDKSSQKFLTINMMKQHKLVEEAKNVYRDQIREINTGEQIFMHPDDLEKAHAQAKATATIGFDRGHKRITKKVDDEREKLITSLDNKYSLLKLNNDTNNKRVIAELGIIYWQFMELKMSKDDTLTNSELQKAHNEGLVQALEDFEMKRGCCNSYEEDAYKDELIQFIEKRYSRIKLVNGNKTKREMKYAVATYNLHMAAVWDQRHQTLHPDDLSKENKTAMRKALQSFRPSRDPSDGFDSDDEDEESLSDILKEQYYQLKDINDAANAASVQSAKRVYKDTLTERESAGWSWLLVVPAVVSAVQTVDLTHHEMSKKAAKNEFYKKRKNKGNESTDTYLIDLMNYLDDINNSLRARRRIANMLTS